MPHIEENQAGLFLYVQADDGTFEATQLSEHNIVGFTLADLDGDGVKEIVARTSNLRTADQDQLLVFHQTIADVPRIQLDFGESCIGGEIGYGELRRRIIPYGNTGSFGHGPNSLTLPFQAGTTLQVEGPNAVVTAFEMEANTRRTVHCDSE